MTKPEFASVITWISVAIGKPIADAPEERNARMDVYFECLGDLPLPAFQIAAKRCAIERKYQSFPPIAELRELATETKKGQVKELGGGEAFGMALRAAGRCDVDVPESVVAAFADLPANVNEAVRQFGFMALYNMPSSQVETARAQFTKIFESIVERERKTGILPAPVQAEIQAIGERNPAIVAAANRAVAAIGVEQ